jgi:hypothetical protein
MAFDPAREEVLLFGGRDVRTFDDTWTWDGADWVRRRPAHSPSKRVYPAMAYDVARGGLLLFGGFGADLWGDTWTWNGSDWAQRPAGSIVLVPRSGLAGSVTRVSGWGFLPGESVRLMFVDSTLGSVSLGKAKTNAGGGFVVQVTIPANATPGSQRVKARGRSSGQTARRIFTVT